MIWPPIFFSLKKENKRFAKLNHNNTLKDILIAVSNDVLTHSQLKELVKITRVFASSFLKNNKIEAVRFASSNGSDLNDLVEDTIGEMFERDSYDKLLAITKFIKSLHQSLEDIDSRRIFLAYYSFTVKFVSLQCAKIYAVHDPGGAAIFKNIKGTIKNSDDFEIYKTKKNTTLIVKNNSNEYDKNYIDYDNFLKEFLSSAQGNKDTGELLKIIYDLLCEQNCSRKEIKLNDVVRLFKTYYKYEERIIEEKDTLLIGDGFSSFEQKELEQLVNRVTKDIKKKIFIDYYTKGKVSREQALGLANTINEILYDWIKVGNNGLTNYEYLTKFLNVDKEEYNSTFKAKLEYLISLSKKQIKFYLENG